jgi:hypothetical protein
MKIGITCRYIYEDGIEKQFVNTKYLEYVESVGFTPIILPINLENTNRLNKEVWWKTLAKFLETHNNSIKYNQFWILNKDKTYSKLTEAIPKNILTIHPNDTSDFINNYHLENKFLPFVKPLLFDEKPQYKLWVYCNDVPQYKLWGDCQLDSYRVYFYRNAYWFYRITQREDLKTLLTENVINLLSCEASK